MEEIYSKIQILQLARPPAHVILEATVPTGLEKEVVKEIVKNEICTEAQIFHVFGRVYFICPVANFENVTNLRSIDNVSLFVDIVRGLNFAGEKEKDLPKLGNLVNLLHVIPSVEHWALITKCSKIYLPSKEEHDVARAKQDKKYAAKLANAEIDENDKEYKHNVIKFRVTCDRIGKHSFSSNEAAYSYGGEINNKYFWIVALSDWDLNVLLRIDKDSAMLLLKVTLRSLHHRSMVSLGPTTLRPTIAYGLLSLANIKPGDHVIDPLCGSGSIPIECMYAFSGAIVSCGDINRKAVDRSLENILAQDTDLPKPSLFIWDAKRLPFRNNSVDVIVSDLPFGKRSGNKRDNSVLYTKIVNEFARIMKEDGRLVLLTKDSPNLYKALQYKRPAPLWKIIYTAGVNVGALKCLVIQAKLNV